MSRLIPTHGDACPSLKLMAKVTPPKKTTQERTHRSRSPAAHKTLRDLFIPNLLLNGLGNEGCARAIIKPTHPARARPPPRPDSVSNSQAESRRRRKVEAWLDIPIGNHHHTEVKWSRGQGSQRGVVYLGVGPTERPFPGIIGPGARGTITNPGCVHTPQAAPHSLRLGFWVP